ncbi:group III truncated hemoglobin [Flavobacterium sp. RHBU_24]|uniref:group III truncated hemoglobin n=1 Tax=Flavobacterium sp. RHBU_24 TaxID=3391185 RepID=UPI003984C17A
MTDILNRRDLEILLRSFYGKLLKDPAISYIFTDVAKINLEEHLPHLVDFWEQMLFHTGGYRKNVMQLHLDLNAKEHLTEKHFEIWLSTFNTTVDGLFVGENAENAKTRGLSVATIMKIKFAQQGV